jgi:hypothetical protein
MGGADCPGRPSDFGLPFWHPFWHRTTIIKTVLTLFVLERASYACRTRNSPCFYVYNLSFALFGIFMLFEHQIFGMGMHGKNIEGVFEIVACENRRERGAAMGKRRFGCLTIYRLAISHLLPLMACILCLFLSTIGQHRIPPPISTSYDMPTKYTFHPDVIIDLPKHNLSYAVH